MLQLLRQAEKAASPAPKKSKGPGSGPRRKC
jgi:hypothetical protein